MNRWNRALAALLAAVLGAGGAAGAEEAGRVEGRVLDAVTGRPVASAAATLSGERVQERIEALTGADGRFEFTSVVEGLYTVTIDAQGHLRAVEPGVRVTRNKATTVDFSLGRALTSELEEVVVSARFAREDPLATPATVQLGREEIRRAPGSFGDVFRALDTLPGVVATGEFSSFTVRSNGPRDNLILVDGIPFDKVTRFDQGLGEQEDIAGGGRYSIFAPNLIGEARFSPGGWRAAEGGRFGSLLELEVARASRSSSTVAVQADLGGFEASYEGPSYVADNTSLLLSARTFDFSRVLKAIGKDNDIGDPTLADFIFKSVTEVNDAHAIELLAIRATEDYSRTVENVLLSPDYEDVSLIESEQDSNLFGVTWRWSLGRAGRLRSAFYYQDAIKNGTQGEAYPDLGGQDPTPASTPARPDILRLAESQKQFGLRTDFTTELQSGATFSAGALVSRTELDFSQRLSGDWVRYVYDQSDYRPDPAQQYIVLTPAGVDSGLAAEQLQFAAYADYSWRIGALSVTPGVRFEHDDLSGQSLFSPRLSATWQRDARTRFWAGGGLYYQAPRYLELAVDPVNAGLGHERSLQLAAGVSRDIGEGLRVLAEGYYQDLQDLIVFDDRTTGTGSNSGVGQAYGLDLMLSKRLSQGWSAAATYSYSDATRDDRTGEGEYPSEWNRRHAVGLLATWDISSRWSLSAKWRYASGLPGDDFVIHDDVLAGSAIPYALRYSKEITTRNATRLPDFHSLTLRVDYHQRIGPVNLIAFLDVANVYGRNNTNAYEWDERRGVNIANGSDSILPLFGLKAEYSWTR
jgi:hypothetical protein